MGKKSFYRRLYDWFIEHWFISACLSSGSAAVFLFVEVLGETSKITVNGVLQPVLFWIAVVIFIISTAYNFLFAAVTNYDNKLKENGQSILNRIIESVDAIKDTKLRRFTAYITENHGKKIPTPFFDITQPVDQIESILENLQDTLADIFGLQRNEISLSVIYHTDQNPSKWQWLYTFNMANDWELETLINNSSSTIRQIIDGKTSSLFFPNKATAIKLGKYLPGPKDESHNYSGSILCRDISIDSKKCVQAILNISTFGRQLCAENDIDTKQKIENLLLPSFERRIKLELALLYIKNVIAVHPNSNVKDIHPNTHPINRKTSS